MTDAIREQLASEVERLRQIIIDLTTNPHVSLGDLVYTVRESEGKGWDGPAVLAWSSAVLRADAVRNGR